MRQSCSGHLGAGRTGGGGAELVYLGGTFWLAGNVAWAWGKEKRADASQPYFLFPRWPSRPGTGARGAGAPGKVGTVLGAWV